MKKKTWGSEILVDFVVGRGRPNCLLPRGPLFNGTLPYYMNITSKITDSYTDTFFFFLIISIHFA